MTNIWEVTTVSDIVKILKSNPKKFVILGLSLYNAPKTEHKMIKKFLKEKSKQYPNITFLFFKVENRMFFNSDTSINLERLSKGSKLLSSPFSIVISELQNILSEFT